jgi:PKD repeat protein
MDEGDYARILLEGDGWWQIACPDDIGGSGSECWVAAGATAVYNTDEIETVTPTSTATLADTPTPTDTPTATPIPVAICRVSASSIGLWRGPGGQRSDGGLIYNRAGFLEEGAELMITGEAYGGQWYQVESLSAGSQGWVYAPNCPLINDGPIPPASGFPPTVTYTPSPTPTPTPTPTNTPSPTPLPSITPTTTGTPFLYDEPIPDFSISEEGFTVYFTNLSQDADSYYWDFGDGYTSTEVNPVHTYVVESEGSYAFTVSLTAYGPGGSNTIVKEDLITGWYIE